MKKCVKLVITKNFYLLIFPLHVRGARCEIIRRSSFVFIIPSPRGQIEYDDDDDDDDDDDRNLKSCKSYAARRR